MVGVLIVVSSGLVGLLFLVVGGLLTYRGATRHRRRENALDRTEPVEATVTTSTTKRVVNSGGEGGASVSYRPVIRFRYEYDGRTYESDTQGWNLGWSKFSTESEAKDRANDYPRGKTLTAYVDPENPGRGFLTRKPGSQKLWDVLLLVMGLVFGGGGFLFGLISLVLATQT